MRTVVRGIEINELVNPFWVRRSKGCKLVAGNRVASQNNAVNVQSIEKTK